jgi:hypothetical protein
LRERFSSFHAPDVFESWEFVSVVLDELDEGHVHDSEKIRKRTGRHDGDVYVNVDDAFGRWEMFV